MIIRLAPVQATRRWLRRFLPRVVGSKEYLAVMVLQINPATTTPPIRKNILFGIDSRLFSSLDRPFLSLRPGGRRPPFFDKAWSIPLKKMNLGADEGRLAAFLFTPLENNVSGTPV